MIYSSRSLFNLADGAIVALLFNRSGVLNHAYVQLARRLNIKITVISVDVQKEESNVTIYGRQTSKHKACDWKQGLKEIEEEYGRAPDIVVSNSPCQYNTFLCPLNFCGDGGPLPGKEFERMQKKTEFTRVFYDCLTMEHVPVIFGENPMGFFDKVVTNRDGSKAFVEVHPWHFGSREEDMHDKRTHWFNGGSIDAIREYPLTKYVTNTERPEGVEKNWVEKMADMNERSKIAPSMAIAIAECSLDRLIFSKATGNSERADLTYDWNLINPPPSRICGTTLSNGKSCNMPENHSNSRRNHLRGKGLEHGVFNYITWEYDYKQTEEFGQTRTRTSTMFEPVDFDLFGDTDLCPQELVTKINGVLECNERDEFFKTEDSKKSKELYDAAFAAGEYGSEKLMEIANEAKAHAHSVTEKKFGSDSSEDASKTTLRSAFQEAKAVYKDALTTAWATYEKVAKQAKKGHICKPLVAKKKAYRCSICNKPKRGHICKPRREIFVAKKKAYKCSICHQPKRGHICKL